MNCIKILLLLYKSELRMDSPPYCPARSAASLITASGSQLEIRGTEGRAKEGARHLQFHDDLSPTNEATLLDPQGQTGSRLPED